MSVRYTAVGWSRHKLVYDSIVASGILGFLAAFVVVGKLAFSGAHSISDEVLVLRALGSCAFLLLTLTLCIGPLARMHPRLLPLLSNRRHLGVLLFVVALGHAGLAIIYYHGFGDVNPLVSLLSTNVRFNSFANFPYQLLGVGALLILFLMAATSHDYWVRNLHQRWWKRLHMMVYVAYALLVGHVALGALQSNTGPLIPAALGASTLCVISLHLVAGTAEWRKDRSASLRSSPWIDAGPAATIPEGRARTIAVRDAERIAVFRHRNGLFAVDNVCPHQGGPLGEGKVIDGCITCPWHGWQIRPEDGCSPPPFTERVRTYEVRVTAGRVEINTTPLTLREPTSAATVEETARG